MEELHYDILIIGAGMAGLMAANHLQEEEWRVALLDKGRSVGGRLATRRIGPGRADHGAQFFTARALKFQKWVEQWLAEDLIYQWSTGWSDGSLTVDISVGHPRYVARGGMNALAKHLAQGLATMVNTQVTKVTPIEPGWRVEDERGQIYTSQALLMTPPVPQSLALLAAGQTQLDMADRRALKKIAYAPCLAGLFWVEGTVDLPEPGTIQRLDEPITWIADNQRKGISPEATIITVHAGPTYSQRHWDTAEADVMAYFEANLRPFLDTQTKILEAQFKRWRYALPTQLHPERYLLATGTPLLAFAGDAFNGPRVEGAALSGLAAAAAIHRQLTARIAP